MVSPGDSLGMKPAPPAAGQPELAWARELCDRVLAEARRRNLSISVAVVDSGGDPIQQDRADGAVAGGVDIALGTAAAAARFGVPSERLAQWYGDAVTRLNPVTVLGVAGGVPLLDDGRTVAGVGVGGAGPAECAALVREVAGP
nr:hypothetical protein GCM10020092_038780 [Actinoplanes digitatis]